MSNPWDEPAQGGDAFQQGAVLSSVPLFPLPNVVLFPRAILPLHIFEERYKVMTADALAGDKQIAMALLQPGWEKNYYGRPAIEPVVCVGTIVSHERLADGKYNFLLQGHSRARIVREVGSEAGSVDHKPYRQADLELLLEPPVMEIDLSNERLRLTALFGEDAYSALPLGRQFLQMLSSPLPTADIVDLIAFNLLDDVALKQKLLIETDPRRRAGRVASALEAMRPMVELATGKSVHSAHLN
jgi:Lon protease-like protein